MRWLWMQKVFDGAFGWFVVHRERAIGKGAERSKDASNAFRIHDKRSHVVGRFGIGLEVRHVVANPLFLRFVPPHLATRRIPRLAVEIARSAVIKDAAVCGPRPRPILVATHPRGIARVAPRR